MEDTQLLKGILEGCVLAVISQGETYGYEIGTILVEYGFEEVQDGTLYPVLTRLEKKKLVSCRVGKSPLGPKRKYFSITEEGIEYLEQFRKSYYKVTKRADSILKLERKWKETGELGGIEDESR